MSPRLVEAVLNNSARSFAERRAISSIVRLLRGLSVLADLAHRSSHPVGDMVGVLQQSLSLGL